jgi:hypothetical protein
MERALHLRNRACADAVAEPARAGYLRGMDALARFAALMAPLDPGEFFARCYEKEPLHLRAADRGVPLLTHDELLAALGERRDPPEGLVAFPEHLDGALAVRDLIADRARLDAYLAAGHPLVWNRARGVSAGIDALSAALAEVFGAQVWPNVYATGEAGTPFDVHFDCHEVIAVQCEGHKTWRISEVRVDRPLDAVEMEPAVAAALRARRDEAEARTALSFTVGPGDVVYIPRGQFHNASAAGGRSLHVTFGIRQLSGFDVVKLLGAAALADPAFREYLPPAAADPGGEGAAARLAEIAARLVLRITEGDLAGEVAAARAALVRKG